MGDKEISLESTIKTEIKEEDDNQWSDNEEETRDGNLPVKEEPAISCEVVDEELSEHCGSANEENESEEELKPPAYVWLKEEEESAGEEEEELKPPAAVWLKEEGESAGEEEDSSVVGDEIGCSIVTEDGGSSRGERSEAYGPATHVRMEKALLRLTEQREISAANNSFSGSKNTYHYSIRLPKFTSQSNNEPSKCCKCGRKIIENRRLVSMRSQTGKGTCVCFACEEECLPEDSHIQLNTKKYSCTVCKKMFSQSAHLKTHERTHTGEKPFSCTICEKKFSKNDNLKEHMRIHTGDKPYPCPVCKKSFSRSRTRDVHIRSHTGETPYSCTVCNKRFTQLGGMYTHMRIHTGEKPFSCSECEKKFSMKQTLVKHMQIHTGDKPVSCPECKNMFSSKSYLVEHMRIHTGEKPFSCPACEKKFSAKGSLKRHMHIHKAD